MSTRGLGSEGSHGRENAGPLMLPKVEGKCMVKVPEGRCDGRAENVVRSRKLGLISAVPGNCPKRHIPV